MKEEKKILRRRRRHKYIKCMDGETLPPSSLRRLYVFCVNIFSCVVFFEGFFKQKKKFIAFYTIYR